MQYITKNVANNNFLNSHYSKFDNFRTTSVRAREFPRRKTDFKSRVSQIVMLQLIFRISEILSLFNKIKIASYLTPEFYLFKKKKFRGITLTNAPLSI